MTGWAQLMATDIVRDVDPFAWSKSAAWKWEATAQ
jgi:hypothetical protein